MTSYRGTGWLKTCNYKDTTMFVDMIYALITFPEIYPVLAVLLFVTLAALLGILVACSEWADHKRKRSKK
jgi:hypothetical protein